MDILSYLIELLKTKKVIGINGLGTLYKKKLPGRYDATSHSFLPPSYELTFTQEIIEEDELVNFISEQKNISHESATIELSEYVNTLHSQLRENQSADLSPLGELKLINDQIFFESFKNAPIGLDFYGLPAVSVSTEDQKQTEFSAEQIEELTQQKEPLQYEQEFDENSGQFIADEEIKTDDDLTEVIEENLLEEENPGTETSHSISDDQPVYDEIAEVNIDLPEQEIENDKVEAPNINEIENLEPEISSQEQEINPVQEASNTVKEDPIWKPSREYEEYEYDDDDDDDYDNTRPIFRILKKVFIGLIIIAIGVAILYFFFPQIFSTVQQTIDTEEPMPSSGGGEGQSVSNDVGTDTMVNYPSHTDTVKKTLVLASALNDSITLEKLKKKTTYEVIASAMKSEKKVNQVIAEFAKRGITAKKMDALPGRLTKISIGTFTNYDSARHYQDSLKRKLRNQEIYIQTIKPKK